MNELLTCVDLTKQYGSKTALDSINLIIPRSSGSQRQRQDHSH